MLFALAFLIASWFGVAQAFEPFVVRDIRVEGLQRTEPGTVFGYLPVKVGDTLTDERAAVAVKALFNAGLFRDVRLEVDNGILVVTVEERPTIGSVSITGTKEFEQEALKKTLREAGLGESRVFDRALLDRAEQELKRQYLTRGFYGVRVTSTAAPLERNRVAVTLTVDEGQTARIAQIRIIGNRAFKDGNSAISSSFPSQLGLAGTPRTINIPVRNSLPISRRCDRFILIADILNFRSIQLRFRLTRSAAAYSSRLRSMKACLIGSKASGSQATQWVAKRTFAS